MVNANALVMTVALLSTRMFQAVCMYGNMSPAAGRREAGPQMGRRAPAAAGGVLTLGRCRSQQPAPKCASTPQAARVAARVAARPRPTALKSVLNSRPGHHPHTPSWPPPTVKGTRAGEGCVLVTVMRVRKACGGHSTAVATKGRETAGIASCAVDGGGPATAREHSTPPPRRLVCEPTAHRSRRGLCRRRRCRRCHRRPATRDLWWLLLPTPPPFPVHAIFTFSAPAPGGGPLTSPPTAHGRELSRGAEEWRLRFSSSCPAHPCPIVSRTVRQCTEHFPS